MKSIENPHYSRQAERGAVSDFIKISTIFDLGERNFQIDFGENVVR